jgi:hypothetical protein
MLFRGCGLTVALLFAGFSGVWADTVVLKNGRRVKATEVREENSKVICETSEGTYSFPRSMVERIEKQQEATPAGQRAPLPLPLLPGDAAQALAPPPAGAAGAAGRAGADAANGAAAPFLAAAQQEIKQGRIEAAMQAVRRGLTALPTDPQLALYYGVLFLRAEKYQEAREWCAKATVSVPAWPQAWKYLGFAEYAADRTDDAVRSWRKSLALAPDAEVQKALERAERELAAEAGHEQLSSSHFTLRFEGRQVPPEFRRALLEELERHYQRLERELGISLREPVPVILYTERAFQQVTQAPSWAAAVNDGRVRIGIQGLSAISSEFSSTLMHEMTHSFVWAKTHGRCPRWLDEGLAQFFEGRSAKGDSRLMQLWREGKRVPLKALEGSFGELGPVLASVAYWQSLAAVQFLTERWGLFDVVRLLDRLAAGTAPEAALRAVYQLDYAGLEDGLSQSLAR